jgi:hypothetical protein
MPITFSVEASKKTVLTTVTGPLLDGDLVGYLADLLNHPAYSPGFSALVVCRDVALGSFSAAAVRRFAQFTREAEQQLEDSRVAIVAHQTAVYGIARMYQLLRDPRYELQVFRELSEAEAWLAGAAQQGRDSWNLRSPPNNALQLTWHSAFQSISGTVCR